jgi:hypothetical protein
MLQEETLKRVKANRYEDPEGEFLELVRSDTNTITVLTRVGGDKVVKEVLPEPSKYTVSELETELEEKVRTEGLTPDQKDTLIADEKSGKNRATAIEAIKEA